MEHMKCYERLFHMCHGNSGNGPADVTRHLHFLYDQLKAKLPSKEKERFYAECKSWICNTVFRVVYCKPVSGQWHKKNDQRACDATGA